MPAIRTPRDQHLISKTVMRPWADPSPGLLGWYSLRFGKSYAKAPTAVAKERDFIAAGVGELEGDGESSRMVSLRFATQLCTESARCHRQTKTSPVIPGRGSPSARDLS
jgi:hypothetical protein